MRASHHTFVANTITKRSKDLRALNKFQLSSGFVFFVEKGENKRFRWYFVGMSDVSKKRSVQVCM